MGKDHSVDNPIGTDLPCAACRYNLRTIRRSSACPECGKSVAESEAVFANQSMDGRVLLAMGNRWLRTVREGIAIALASWAVVTYAGLSCNPWGNYYTTLTGLKAITPLSIAFVLAAWAAWHVCAPPSASGLRLTTSRLFIVMSVVAPALTYLNRRWIAFYLADHLHRALVHTLEDASDFVSSVGIFASFAGILAPAFVLGRVSWIANAGRRQVARVLSVIMAVLACVAGLAQLVEDWSALDNMILRVSPIATCGAAGVETQAFLTSRADLTELLPIAVAHLVVLGLLTSTYLTLTRAIRLGGLPASSSPR